MLERTAGCLESGSLRRLLPTSKTSIRSCRKLHSGFWAHAGGDIELSPFWATFFQAATPPDCKEGISILKAQLGITFLDFLYPSGALNLLKHYSVRPKEQHDGQWARHGPSRITQRRYASSMTQGTLATDTRAQQEDDATGQSLESTSEDINMDDLFRAIPQHRQNDFPDTRRRYQLLPADVQDELKPLMIHFLAQSEAEVDTQMITQLYATLGKPRITVAISQIAIQSHLRIQNLADAMAVYAESIEVHGYPIGAADIFAYLMLNDSWTQAMTLWQEMNDMEPHINDLNIFEVIDNHNLHSVAINLAEYVHRTEQQDSSAPAPSALKDFAAVMVQRALVHPVGFTQSKFESLMQLLQLWKLDDPDTYEEAVQMLWSLRERKLVLKYYRHARRRVKFSRATLTKLLQICCQYHVIQGIKEVLDDFIGYYNGPTLYAFRLSMKFFASRGDSVTVHALWEQYITLFSSDSSVVLEAADLSAILQVHSVRGEIQEVVKWFNKIKDTYFLDPDIMCWNILLNAYGRVKDYESAYSCFESILNDRHCTPDQYTIGTMMTICTRQGDIDRTIELYMLAENLGISKNVVMLTNLVVANIRDDDLEQAETICIDSLEMDLPKGDVRMWNCLLGGHAKRYDLNAVYRILQLMSKAGLEFNEFTYGVLMQALVMLKLPDRANDILRDVMPDAGAVATNFHYDILMGGYIRIGNSRKAKELQKRMHRQNIQDSPSTSLTAIKAKVYRNEHFPDDKSQEELLAEAMTLFRDAMQSMDAGSLFDHPAMAVGVYSADNAIQSMFYSYVMRLLALTSDPAAVDALYDEFFSGLSESRQEHSPLDIMAALMLGKLRANDHESVEGCWKICLEQATDRGQPLPPISTGPSPDGIIDPPLSPHKILPIHQLDLARHTLTYLESLFVQNRLDAMIATVENLLETGFKLDNRTWNRLIQMLVEKHRYKTAFKYCEEQLMDRWTGWQMIRWRARGRRRLSVTFRHLRKQRSHLRPIHVTLLHLARALLNVQVMAPESRPMQELFKELRTSYPKISDAIETMPRTGDDLERQILEDYY